MELTSSFEGAFPDTVLARYEFVETRNAAAILKVTNPLAWSQLIEVLEGFSLRTEDLLTAGGNESGLAARLNSDFRSRGWREGRVDTRIRLELRLQPYGPAGETQATLRETESVSEGYLVDNFRDRVALDVEWNAKDGNLDRDIAAYRSLYDAGLIDGAVMVTRTQTDLRALGQRLALESGLELAAARRILGTTTTTNVEKLRPRMARGDAGGCPMVAILISSATHA
jgi:hypothetical protein